MARRNISKYDRTRLALKQEEVYVKQAKEQQKRKPIFVPSMLTKQKNRQKILSGTKKPLDTRKKVRDILEDKLLDI